MADAKVSVRVDSAGLMKYAQESLADDVHAAAEKVAENIRRELPSDIQVNVRSFINDVGRPVARVVVAHPSALARQAKDGLITKAVAKAGYDVHRYEPKGG